MSQRREGREDKDVPASVRAEVRLRDNDCCRLCGQHTSNPGVHHVWYRSRGGREGHGLHVPSNLIVVNYAPFGCQCHSELAHGVEAHVWRDVLTQVLDSGQAGLTAMAARRWLGL